jgi:hypothetical protein
MGSMVCIDNEENSPNEKIIIKNVEGNIEQFKNINYQVKQDQDQEQQ